MNLYFTVFPFTSLIHFLCPKKLIFCIHTLDDDPQPTVVTNIFFCLSIYKGDRCMIASENCPL